MTFGEFIKRDRGTRQSVQEAKKGVEMALAALNELLDGKVDELPMDRWSMAVQASVGLSQIIHSFDSREIARRMEEIENDDLLDPVKRKAALEEHSRLVDIRRRMTKFNRVSLYPSRRVVEAEIRFGDAIDKRLKAKRS